MFEGLHHMQLAMPPGEEDAARRFFVSVLGMTELDKPLVLAARGGAWFRAGGLELHPLKAGRKSSSMPRCSSWPRARNHTPPVGVDVTPMYRRHGCHRDRVVGAQHVVTTTS